MPQVTWLKDGQAVAEAGDARIVSSGRSLHISRAQLLDTGRYMCVASNPAGDRSKTYSLNVLGESWPASARGTGSLGRESPVGILWGFIDSSVGYLSVIRILHLSN